VNRSFIWTMTFWVVFFDLMIAMSYSIFWIWNKIILFFLCFLISLLKVLNAISNSTDSGLLQLRVEIKRNLFNLKPTEFRSRVSEDWQARMANAEMLTG
jgi:hypothetical protein